VKSFVLALEQYRNLTKPVSITDRIEAKHKTTSSPRRARCKIFSRLADDKRRRREHDAADERAALEEELQLAHRQPHAARGGVAPQGREAPALQALGVDAEPGPVPEQDLGARARGVDEQVAVPRQGLCDTPHSPCYVAGRDMWRVQRASLDMSMAARTRVPSAAT